MLELIDGDEPLGVKVKNRFREHLEVAREKGYKRGYAFHKVMAEFGDEAKNLIPRHTGDWYRRPA